MHQTIDRCGCGHGVFEDPIPLTENEVAGDHETASFVALGQKGEQNFHLFGLLLLDVADLVEDDDIVAIELFEQCFESEIPSGDEHLLYEMEGAAEVDGSVLPDH